MGTRTCRQVNAASSSAARLAMIATLVLIGHAGYASAQTGTIAGQVQDSSGQPLVAVTVTATSPALIEGARTTTTAGEDGTYRLSALPVGHYELRFTRTGFGSIVRAGIEVTSGSVIRVSVDLPLETLEQEVVVDALTTGVDLSNAHVQATFSGADIAALPTARDVPSLLLLMPALTTDRRICNGSLGAFCYPTAPAFNAYTAASDPYGGLNQGRLLINGMPINGGRVSSVFGIANGLTFDPANAEEVTLALSGGLGGSETGGASINIVPRAGGNRYSGSFYTSYLHERFFDRNHDSRTIANQFVRPYILDYDVNGSFGGPVVRNRLWFHAYAGKRGSEYYPSFGQTPGYANLNEGLFAANYVPDRARGPMTTRDDYTKANLRLTLQASPRNRFDLYWDEQSSCASPCFGMSQVMVSPEAYWSQQTSPNRLTQLSWTNSFSDRMLFEAGLSYVSTHEDTTRHRQFTNYQDIPRVCEFGSTVGLDAVATRTPPLGFGADTAGTTGHCRTEAIHSGSFNYPFATVSNPELNGLGPSALINHDTYRSRASAAYVAGPHYATIGFEGAYFSEQTVNQVNNLRMNYHYRTPEATSEGSWNSATRTGNCLAAPPEDVYSCGNMTMYHPEDADNRTSLRPRPIGFEMNTGSGVLDERVWFGALYLQDQWTLGRLSLTGALRYDHAESRYGASCVGPDVFVPIQDDGSRQWCSSPKNGARYNDLTPRWGVVWDVFGTGTTAVKWNMGKYLHAAALNGLFVDDNPARRSTNALTRGWDDLNGNRIIDCDLTNPSAHTVEGGDFCRSLLQPNGMPTNEFASFGRPPAPGTSSAVCGRTENASPLHQAYCDEADQNLMTGWNTRRHVWQLGIGVQHEILPGLVGELTYNRNAYGNLSATDRLMFGCDYYGPKAAEADARACATRHMNYESDLFDFYRLTAPLDPRLPGGGGYVIRGLTNQKTPGPLPSDAGSVALIRDDLAYAWQGFDTDVTLRAVAGLRLSAGTSTGRATRDLCYTSIDTPNVKGRDGNDYAGGCRPRAAVQTNVRANASYLIPRLDVLVGTVFQYRPGVARAASFTLRSSGDVIWEAGSAHRTGGPFYTAAGQTQLQTFNLLDAGDLYGEGIRILDLKATKQFRFNGKRLVAGVDVFNVFNSDAILQYDDRYTVFKHADGAWSGDNPTTAAIEHNPWGTPRLLMTARHLKFTVQFDF